MNYQGPADNRINLQSPTKAKKKRWLRYVAFLFVVVALAAGLLIWLQPKTPHTQRTSNIQDKNAFRLVAVGDNIPHETVNNAAKTSNGYNYAQFFEPVEKYIKKGDVRFCNSESAVAGEEFGISGYPTFNAPSAFARDLSSVGCNVINLANNHVGDKGAEGISKTREVWESEQPLALSGANRNLSEQNQVSYAQKNGLKIAFVAFSELSNNTTLPSFSVNMFDEDLVSKLLAEARSKADVVIVSAHWGTEDSSSVNETQKTWAKKLADQGADVVIGTGPHVLQPVEFIPTERGKTLVWYSLGNFLSSQLDINQLIGGIASVKISKKNGHISFDEIKFLPTYMHYEWSTQEKASQDLLKRKNLKLYPLDSASDALSRSLHNTSADQELSKVKSIINNGSVEIVPSGSF
jgi:poly-gamma-glutamate capsule biosynthesis protein CapA/YwtB (metallophosphatase superfamily)